MACIVAPAVCGCIGLVLINGGLVAIRMAFNSSKANPVVIPKDCEQKTLAKIDKRLSVSFWRDDFIRQVFSDQNLKQLLCFS
jgi:hypothetical protein